MEESSERFRHDVYGQPRPAGVKRRVSIVVPRQLRRRSLSVDAGRSVAARSSLSPPPSECRDERIQTFAVETSLHGVVFWLNPRKWGLFRALFFLLWVVMVGLCIFIVQGHIRRFFHYRTQVTITEEMKEELPFPSVTICPENSWMRSLIGGSKVMLAAIAALRPDFNVWETCYSPGLNDSWPTMQSVLVYLHTLEEREASGRVMPPFQRVFHKCRFRDQPINCSEAFIGHVNTGGRCFTFNFAGNYESSSRSLIWLNSPKDRVLRQQFVTGAGLQNSLQLRLDSMEDEGCFSSVTDNGGFRVIIHDQNFIPAFLDDSILISPGFRTQIALTETRIDRNNTENLGRCTSSKTLELYPNSTYNRENCILQCLAKIVWRECECMLTYLTVDYGVTKERLNASHPVYVPPEDMNICFLGPPATCQYEVIRAFRYRQNFTECYDDCPHACYLRKYDWRTSSAPFPPVHLQRQLARDSAYATPEQQRLNLLELDIYFSSMQVTTIQEDWALTGGSLFSNVGGALGLFLGASVFSFFEVLELIYGLATAKKRAAREAQEHLQAITASKIMARRWQAAAKAKAGPPKVAEPSWLSRRISLAGYLRQDGECVSEGSGTAPGDLVPRTSFDSVGALPRDPTLSATGKPLVYA